MISPDYTVLRPLGEISVRYFEFLFKTPVFISHFRNATKGIVEGFWRLYTDDFYNVRAIVPPPHEQQKIVEYLEDKLVDVGRFISNKRQLIGLLKKEKNEIRRICVTRGIKNSSMKPSNIFWLSEIPKDWKSGRIKSEFENLNTRRIPLNSVDRGEMKNREFDYYGASGVIDKVDDYLFDETTILIAEDGANLVLRNLRLSIIAKGKYWVNNHAHILKPKRGCLFYLAEMLEAIDYNPWITGAAQPKLTKDRLMGIEIPVPPIPEQESIAEHLKSEYSRIDKLIDSISQEIRLMTEFRSALIAEAVTGKLDLSNSLSPQLA